MTGLFKCVWWGWVLLGGGVWLGVEGCNRGTFLRGQGIMETLATRALSSRLALV